MMFVEAEHPSMDEVEVIVFGPGYGESIAVHIGQGSWIIVDSCIDSSTKTPVAKNYLDTIGVRPDQVKVIVVSHWHDDHTRGISDLVSYYSQARVGVSSIFNNKEGKDFLTAFSGKITGESAGTSELFSIFFDHKKRIDHLSQNSQILPASTNHSAVVLALSPTSECFFQATEKILSALPTKDKLSPVREAPRFAPNNEAIVVHINIGDFAILLGSDLESESNAWVAMVSHPNCKELKSADFYKVAHHGSITAECDEIWKHLLSVKPVSVLTPFTNGSVKLPNEIDKQRISLKSSSLHTTSNASIKPLMNQNIARRLATMGTSPVPVNTKLGAVRSRKKINNAEGSSGWSFKYFGAAGRI